MGARTAHHRSPVLTPIGSPARFQSRGGSRASSRERYTEISRGGSRGTTGEDRDREGFRGLFAGGSRGIIEDSGLGLLGSREDRDKDRDKDRGRQRDKEKEKEGVIASSVEGLDSRISDLKILFQTVDPVERMNYAATR
jgi:hypothetical protein